MNFDDLIQKIIEDFYIIDCNFTCYSVKGNIDLFIDEYSSYKNEVKYETWNRMCLKGSVRKKSLYLFDIYMTITKYNEGYEVSAWKIIKKSYFNLNTLNDKIPVKDKPNTYASISSEIFLIEKI